MGCSPTIFHHDIPAPHDAAVKVPDALPGVEQDYGEEVARSGAGLATVRDEQREALALVEILQKTPRRLDAVFPGGQG